MTNGEKYAGETHNHYVYERMCPKWYWVALRPNEMAFQVIDSDRQGFISDLKTLRGVENRLSKIKGADWAMTMREVPSRIEVYTYLNPLDISSYRKIKAWSI